MVSPHTPKQKTRATSVSLSDTSQASEDNSIASETDEDENPHTQRWAADLRKDLTIDSKKLKNGKYGMFSEKSPKSPPKTRSSTSKRQRSSSLGAHGKNRQRKMLRTVKEKRMVSPIFEPEDIMENQSIISDHEEVLLSPAPPAQSSKRHRRQNNNPCTIYGNHQDAPIEFSDSESKSEVSSEDSVIPASSPSQPPFQAAEAVCEDAPLPGNPAVLPEYLDITQKLSALVSAENTESDNLRSYREEESHLTRQLEKIPAKLEAQNKAMAIACAAAIQKDMQNMAFADVNDIQTVFEKRRAEAEKKKAAIGLQVREKEVEYETRKQTIIALRKGTNARLHGIEDKIEELKTRKRQLEDEGGCALGFELGRKAAAQLTLSE